MAITSGEELILKTSVKVSPLCGVKVKKIVIGKQFGAALTEYNELYFWGLDVVQVDPKAVVMIRKYSPNTFCMKCCGSYTEFTEYKSSLSYCSACQLFPTYSSPPSPRTLVSHLVDQRNTLLSGQSKIYCIYCGEEAKIVDPIRRPGCGPSFIRQINDFKILFCSKCSHFLVAPLCDIIPPQTAVAPHKVNLSSSLQIVDISSGGDFLIIRTASNDIVVWGTIGMRRYKNYVINPDNVVIEKVCCGSNHIAVVSSEGELYTCGLNTSGCLGYDWNDDMGYMTLRKVPLSERVVNIVCGNASTICVVKGRAISATGLVVSGSQIVSEFFRLPALNMTHRSVQNRMSCLENLQGMSTILTGDLSDMFVPIHTSDNLVHSSTVHGRDHQEDTIGEVDTTTNTIAIPSVPQINLYGKTLFSDLTFKLSDGNFPSHWPILSTSSVYFSQLAQTDPPSELDVSAYNPESYRNLLKYFYRIPLGQLSCRDMLDLYLLADSYKERLIATDVLSKLKSSITMDTAVHLHDMAAAAKVGELVDACKSFINKPEFKTLLLQRLTQEDVLLDLLRLTSKSKPA